MKESRKCINCVYCAAEFMNTGTRLFCTNINFPLAPIPTDTDMTCDEYKGRSGISVKDKYPEKAVEFKERMLAKGYEEWVVDDWLDSDSAIVEG